MVPKKDPTTRYVSYQVRIPYWELDSKKDTGCDQNESFGEQVVLVVNGNTFYGSRRRGQSKSFIL
jgi:hypothetical protein